VLTFQQNTLVCAIFNFTPAHLSRFPTSFAYFPAIIICICENFPPIVILIRFWYFAPIAICNLPFFTICFARIVCRLYWSHNRAKWAKKKQRPPFASLCSFLFFYGVPIFDRWCVKMCDVARGGDLCIFAYLINLFGFLGGFLWKNNKHFIVCCGLEEWGIWANFYSSSNSKDAD